MTATQRSSDRAATEAAIIALLRSGDESDRTRGITQLLEHVSASIAGMLRRRYQMPEDEIDQALIAAAYRVWKRADSFAPERGSLLTFTRRIADNEAVNLIRQRRIPRDDVRIVPISDEIEARPDSSSIALQGAADLVSDETQKVCLALREIIAELPPMQRRIAEADLQHPECCVPARDLAAEIKTSPDAVYVHRNRYKETISRKMRMQGLMPA